MFSFSFKSTGEKAGSAFSQRLRTYYVLGKFVSGKWEYEMSLVKLFIEHQSLLIKCLWIYIAS